MFSDVVRILLLLGLLGAISTMVLVWRRIRLQELTRARLKEADQPATAEETDNVPVRLFLRRYRLVVWLAAAGLVAGLYFLVGLPLKFAVVFGLVAGLVGSELESGRAARIRLRMEEQLADAIDLMVGALRAGAGVTSALESAAHEARMPLRPQLEEVLGRIRFGDDPQEVLKALEARVPLETFRLFCSAMSLHWETGGSLSATLATVGRVIRDRIEIQRRIRAMTMQARLAVNTILVVTYFLALLIWRNNPDGMRQFLASAVGQYLVLGAILLQGVGRVWASALSRLKY